MKYKLIAPIEYNNARYELCVENINDFNLQDKVIAIWGMGREGNALLEYFSKHNIGKEIRTFVDDTEVNLQGVEIVVKSPGVSAYKPEIIQAKNNGIRFTSASDLFLNEIRTNKPNVRL